MHSIKGRDDTGGSCANGKSPRFSDDILPGETPRKKYRKGSRGSVIDRRKEKKGRRRSMQPGERVDQP